MTNIRRAIQTFENDLASARQRATKLLLQETDHRRKGATTKANEVRRARVDIAREIHTLNTTLANVLDEGRADMLRYLARCLRDDETPEGYSDDLVDKVIALQQEHDRLGSAADALDRQKLQRAADALDNASQAHLTALKACHTDIARAAARMAEADRFVTLQRAVSECAEQSPDADLDNDEAVLAAKAAYRDAIALRRKATIA